MYAHFVRIELLLLGLFMRGQISLQMASVLEYIYTGPVEGGH